MREVTLVRAPGGGVSGPVISVLGGTLGGLMPVLMPLLVFLTIRFGGEIADMTHELLNPATRRGTIILGLLVNVIFAHAPAL